MVFDFRKTTKYRKVLVINRIIHYKIVRGNTLLPRREYNLIIYAAFGRISLETLGPSNRPSRLKNARTFLGRSKTVFELLFLTKKISKQKKKKSVTMCFRAKTSKTF